MDIKVLKLSDRDYPLKLKQINNPPEVLFCRGNVKLLRQKKVIAVVGSRKMTSYGEYVCSEFTRELIKKGYTTISGLAKGIDACCHRKTMENKGYTIAVLGGGLDIYYPRENEALYEEIIKSRGLIISEYPLGTPPLAQNFRMRNRIISGLSDGVLVVEGEKRSGTLITAKYAAEQGKDVFAVPGPITSKLSEAPHFLIENGCVIASSVEKVIEELKN